MDRPPRSRRQLLAPASLLRVLALMALTGGVFTFVAIVAPHADTTYDSQFLVVGACFVAFGILLLRVRSEISAFALHVACLILSGGVLALAWFGMRDVGGVQAIFLFLVLSVATMTGRPQAGFILLVAQSAGYAIVLATSPDPANFDQVSQWLVVTLGLIVSLLLSLQVRRQLLLNADRDAMMRDEQAHQRAAHAEQLEQLNSELREANELKSRFVAMASHELRTPLTAISGFASTMRNRWTALSDDDKHRFVEIIDEQADRLGRLVTDLLTLSRIESGRLDANVRPVAVREVIDRTVRELGIEDVHVEGDDQLQALADEDYLQQILVNYLGNASAYGEPPVTVSVAVTNGWVELLVSDRGPGVPVEFVPKLFDRFARGPADVRPDMPSGTGLGLSIVEGLAHAHGGTAWYEPNLPNGSRFGVRLPAARVDA